MKFHRSFIEVITQPDIFLHDITGDIRHIVGQSGILNGFVTINSMHTTTALTINEFEKRLLEDVKSFLKKIVPPTDRYLHNDISLRDCPPDEPENAHSHLASMLLGNTENIILIDGMLQLGQWQSVLLVELDGPRSRRVAVQVAGA